jgi:ubiquinone/menaquinone biosynthesis C-methylase UbiE
MEQMLEATARAEDRHFWFQGLRRNARYLLTQALRGRRPRLIVDCGAGTGRNLDWLSEFGPAVGLERSPVGLRVGRAKGRRLVRGSVTALPFPDAAADVATSFDVLYCLDDDSETQAVAEMQRILAPRGIVIANVAALDVLRGSHSTLTMEVRRYTKARLRAVFERQGFTIERMTFTNMATFPITLAVRVKDRMTGKAAEASDDDLAVPAAPINSALAGALAVEGAMLHVANLPIGSSLLCVARRL